MWSQNKASSPRLAFPLCHKINVKKAAFRKSRYGIYKTKNKVDMLNIFPRWFQSSPWPSLESIDF